LGSRPWPFKVTWRHHSCDHSSRHMPFRINDPLQLTVYLQSFSRYSAPKMTTNILTNALTDKPTNTTDRNTSQQGKNEDFAKESTWSHRQASDGLKYIIPDQDHSYRTVVGMISLQSMIYAYRKWRPSWKWPPSWIFKWLTCFFERLVIKDYLCQFSCFLLEVNDFPWNIPLSAALCAALTIQRKNWWSVSCEACSIILTYQHVSAY